MVNAITEQMDAIRQDLADADEAKGELTVSAPGGRSGFLMLYNYFSPIVVLQNGSRFEASGSAHDQYQRGATSPILVSGNDSMAKLTIANAVWTFSNSTAVSVISIGNELMIRLNQDIAAADSRWSLSRNSWLYLRNIG